MAPNVYGAGHFRKAGSPGNQYDFLQQFRANKGQFFDDSMKAQLCSPAGIKTLENMIAANKASIPGNNELDAVSLWAAFLQGKVAMIYSWPPTGRMCANYSQSAKAINFIPQSSIAGKVGYALVPGNPEMATGYNKALSADSANAEAAYLFMQWAVSPPVSLARTMLPYSLRDPYRLSHYKSELYRLAMARREGLSRQPLQFGQCRPARHDHAGLAGLCAQHRSYVLLGLGGNRSQGGAANGRG